MKTSLSTCGVPMRPSGSQYPAFLPLLSFHEIGPVQAGCGIEVELWDVATKSGKSVSRA